ncbi:MAG: helix-turn-helix transcriptional regulator [Lachnospiraceae bacterium]|nr:helix-turn-helix transcriptional regulator [Lachnospiraceae bacterium]
MMHAYDETYVEKARTALGRMLDFAVYDMKFELPAYWNLFLTSGVARRFGEGDFTLTVGKSGIEIAYTVLDESGLCVRRITPCHTRNRSEEYWTGWALAWYQWEKALPFQAITCLVPIEEIQQLYSPYHEMDIRQFADRMDDKCREAQKNTRLKQMRMRAGYSQQKLADMAGIPLRTLQQYEQKQKNINKARAEYVIRLSQVLGCGTDELIEYW